MLGPVLLMFMLLIPLPGISGTAADTGLTVRYSIFMKSVNAYWLKNQNTTQDAHQLGQFVAARYQRLFPKYQAQSVLGKLTSNNLETLFQATDQVSFYNPENAVYLRYMKMDFAALEARNIATNVNTQHMYGALYAARLFGEARAFYQTHAKVALTEIPVVKQFEAATAGPTELLVEGRKTQLELVRRAVEVNDGPQVVLIVNPMCHFATNGLQAINADAELKAILEKHTIWLAPPGRFMFFSEIREWNELHLHEQIGIAYLSSEWPMVNSWDLPTFYFFNNGTLVTKLIGWPSGSDVKYPDSGSIPALKAALAKIGLLQPPA